MRRARLLFRALTILVVVTQHLLRYLVGWLVLWVVGRDRAARQALFGACVLSLFRRLGATFIKVGQIMSTRPDLLPPHVIDALSQLQDNVGPFDFGAVRAILAEDLGRPLEEIFAEFSPVPIASASVSQVHRARLPDGQIVAVKVRRPNIEELCAFDLSVMRLFARLLELMPSMALLAPVESVEQFARAVQQQLDFTIEAENNRRFRRNFAGDKDVVFPRLVDELCTRRVLVMEYIEGVKILEFRRTGAEPRRLGKIGFRVLLKMIFEDGFVHADLHPGNVFITSDHRVALLDLGLVGQLDSTHRQAFARYFAAWAQNDGRTMAQIMIEHSPSRDAIPDPAGFTRAVEEFVGRYYGKRLGEVHIAVVVFEMMQILRTYRVRVNATFTVVNIAIAMTEGIGKQLDPTLDLMAEALPFFARFDFFQTTAP
ncbi:MAG: AarF/UbiB family protein [Myxococcales bacterium]|nr:AarF/UbiB family protein [Myxococcota bacterium]MDW8280804.1 AarF/UbiB family protein [Myxococcales bacterium]